MSPRFGAPPTAPSPPLLGAFVSMPRGELIVRYRSGSDHFERRLLELSDAQLDTAFRAESGVGRWPCRALVAHIADAEVVNAHRMRRIVGEDRPLLANWDENSFLDFGVYGPDGEGSGMPVAGSVAVIHALRLWMADWLRAMPELAWERSGLHPESGEMTLATILVLTTWHLEHHAWYLSKKLELMLGPRDETCASGGACGCRSKA